MIKLIKHYWCNFWWTHNSYVNVRPSTENPQLYKTFRWQRLFNITTISVIIYLMIK